MRKLSLITGGARSGKSSHAIALATAVVGTRIFFIATGEPLDQEMASRIAHHKASRPPQILTIEESREVASAIASLEGKADVAIMDCLTLWISNLMSAGASDESILAQADRLADVLTKASFTAIVVTDEVGAGIVPDNPVARRFRDLLGWTNQKIAAVADDVTLMVAGYPLRVK